MLDQPYLTVLIVVVVLILLPATFKVVWQYEKGLVVRFGKLRGERNPGLNFILPYVDRLVKVDMRVETLVVEPQEVITQDNVTVQVDAVVYFKPGHATDTIVKLQNYAKATSQIAQTPLRSVLGQSDLTNCCRTATRS